MLSRIYVHYNMILIAFRGQPTLLLAFAIASAVAFAVNQAASFVAAAMQVNPAFAEITSPSHYTFAFQGPLLFFHLKLLLFACSDFSLKY